MTALPALPRRLVKLLAGSNRLTDCPPLPDQLTELNLSSNPLHPALRAVVRAAADVDEAGAVTRWQQAD